MRCKALFALLVSFIPLQLFAESKFNMTQGVTKISAEIYQLHMTIFLICCVIGVIVFGVLLYSLAHHRKSKGAVAADFHEHVGVEIAWAVAPFIILIVMAVPATRVLMDMRDVGKADISIKVTGYQWKWEYEYLSEGIRFMSNLSTSWDEINNKASKGQQYLLEVDNPIVIPIHKKIRFLVTSNDVLHSWWVPAFGVKRDAVPAYIHETWAKVETPGVYRGQCAELCGAKHGFMPIVVKALPQIEYDQWLKGKLEDKRKLEKAAKQKMTFEQLMEKGEAAYNINCAACHKVDGSGSPPAFPALKAGKLTVGPVAGHLKVVIHGAEGTAMQAFGSQIDPVTLAAIITYERNAWGNDKLVKDSKIVQPSDVVKAQSQ